MKNAEARGLHMLILGVSTSDPECSAALCRNGDVLEEHSFQGARSCVEELVPLIESMLKNHGMGLKDVDAFAADIGPGGLTGIKIGVVTIRTLAQAMDRPVAGVSSLHAMACDAASAGGDIILCATPCSDKEIYSALFEPANGAPRRLTEDSVHEPAQLADLLKTFAGRSIVITGNAADAAARVVRDATGVEPVLAPPEQRPPHARNICALAESAPPAEWSALQANYLCITNAERNLARRGA